MNTKRTPTPNEPYTGDTVVMPKRSPALRPTEPLPPSKPAPKPTPPKTAPRRRSRPIWPFVRLGILVFIVLIVVIAGATYWQVRNVATELVVRDARFNAPAFSGPFGGMNVLVVGVDERPDHPEEGVRSDTLIVVHTDANGRWTNLLSIPRDTLVSIDDFETKINVAYGQGYASAAQRYGANTTPQQGGMALAAQTVEQALNLPAHGQRIDYVAQINFDGFANVIDALGGVTINVPKYIEDDEYPTADFGIQRVEFQPGVQRMDGATALIYARTRHADSDFDRGARQQQVMRAIITELRAKGTVGMALSIPKLGEGLQGAVTTTLPFARPDMLLGLLWVASGLQPDEIGQVQLSPETDPEYQQDDAFNLIWSQSGIDTAVNALLTRPGEAAESATVQVLNGTGITGLAGDTTSALEREGFTVVPAADAPRDDIAETVVYDVGGKPRTAKRLADSLHAPLRDGLPDGVSTSADIVVLLGKDKATR